MTSSKRKVGTRKKRKVVKEARRSLAATLVEIDAFVATLNKKMQGVGRIDRGKDIGWLDPPRIRSGILGVDIASAGGLPRGGICQFWGPSATGKTSTALRAMRAEQLRGKSSLFCAGEGFNKTWARKNGLWIPYSSEEYDDDTLADDMREFMEEYDRWGVDNKLGDVLVVQHTHGDGLLEAAAQAVKQNLFSVIVVDSLAMLRNERQLEEAEVGDEERGGGGQITMFNRFIAKCYSGLNSKYDANNVRTAAGEYPNETCVICINQARMKGLAGGRPKPGMGPQYEPPGGQMLRHAWHFSLQFSRGEVSSIKESLDGTQKFVPYAREINVRCDKSKIGLEGRHAWWDLYLRTYGDFEAGDVDRVKECRIWATYYKVVDQVGSWFELADGRRFNGKERFEDALREDEDLVNGLEEKVLVAARKE